MNKVFQNNLSALKNSKLREILKNYNCVSKPQLISTNGYNLEYNGNILHNQENPLAESQGIFNNNKNNAENTFHIIYGLGLGYLFQISAAESKGTVILYEPNLDIMFTSFTLVDFSNELSKQNVYIFNDFSDMREFIQNSVDENSAVQIFSLPSYREFYKEKFAKDTKSLEMVFGGVLLDYGYKRKRLYDATYNVLYNIPQLLKETPINKFENIYEGKTAIIVSAGPTLGENIDVLNKYKDNAVIFAVGPALKTLAKNNIKADFLCILEAFDCIKQVEGLDLKDIDLILEPYTYSSIHALNAKNIFLHVSDNMPTNKYWSEVTGINTEGYSTQGTVSFLGLNTAVKMGFKKIIFVGQDLAYIDGQCYSKGSSSEELVCIYNPETQKYKVEARNWDKFINSLSSASTEERKIRSANERLLNLNSTLYTIKSIEGKMIPTEIGYASFVQNFTEYAKTLEGIELINTSLKGAQIDGYKNMSLEEAMADSEKMEKIELKAGYDYNIDDILNKLSKTNDYMKYAAKICEESNKLLSRLNMEIKRNKSVDKEKLFKIRKLIENYTILNDSTNEDNQIFRYLTASEEMDLNDLLLTVKNYDEKIMKNVITELKKYYTNINEKLKVIDKVINKSLDEVKEL